MIMATNGALVEPIAEGVVCYIQCGSQEVFRYCQEQGYDRIFQEVGAIFVEPSCGACSDTISGCCTDSTMITFSS